MGHYVQDADRMFHRVIFRQKTTPELRVALEAKVTQVNQLLTDRTRRVEQICTDYDITDQQLTNLVLQFQDEDSSFVSFESQGDETQAIPAGAIANIVQEKKMSESERAQLRRLERLLRNLQDTEYFEHPETGEISSRPCIHVLSDIDLEYLGL